MVVASSVKLHISYEGIGVDREAVGDNFPSRCYSETGFCFMVFPEKGEGNPYRGKDWLLAVRLKSSEHYYHNNTIHLPSGPQRVGSLMQEFW